MVLASLGSRLREARKSRGFDQKALAEAIGVHPKTVSRWENDAQPPEGEAVELLARLLGVSPTWLRYGEEGVRDRLTAAATGDSPDVHLGAAAPEPASFSQRARAFVNRFMAELAEAGVTEDEESWARRVLMSPDNYGFNAGGNTPTLSEEAMLRDMEGMSIGVRHILRARGYKDLPLSGPEP